MALLPEERLFRIDLPSGEVFTGAILLDEGRRSLIKVGDKTYRMLWSERWGPCVADQHGDPANTQPGPRHAFWRAASLWNRQGRRMKGAEAIWHEPAPEILQRIGRYRRGWEIRVVQAGEDPLYSKTIWDQDAPAERGAHSPSEASAGKEARDEPNLPNPTAPVKEMR